MTSSDLAKYSMTRSTRGISATAELLVSLTLVRSAINIALPSVVCNVDSHYSEG